MRRFIRTLVASFAMLSVFAGMTSCTKDMIREKKILGTWEVEKLEMSFELEGVHMTESVTPEEVGDDMFSSMTFKSGGEFVIGYVGGQIVEGSWSYAEDKLTLTASEDSDSETIVFDVVELDIKKMVLATDLEGFKVHLYLKK